VLNTSVLNIYRPCVKHQCVKHQCVKHCNTDCVLNTSGQFSAHLPPAGSAVKELWKQVNISQRCAQSKESVSAENDVVTNEWLIHTVADMKPTSPGRLSTTLTTS